MAQGARVEGNLLHDNTGGLGDIFLEMQHGPILICNNLLLSERMSFFLNSKGIAIVHNLIRGPIGITDFDGRNTPFHRAHSTEFAGLHDAPSGDCRFYNNLFVAPCKLAAIDHARLPCFAAGNVFTPGSQPSKFDADLLLKPDSDPGIKLEQKPDGWYFTLSADTSWTDGMRRKPVTTEMLGRARIPNLPYENADGSPLRVATDYFGKQRNTTNPFPGPFEISSSGPQTFKVWPNRDQ
jgi:alpha-N-arabinofuranosidase